MTNVYALRLNWQHSDTGFWQLLDVTGSREYLNFLKKEDAFRSLFGNILARFAILQEKNIDFKDKVFDCNSHGKPFAKGLDIHFNLSHAGEWVVCATSDAETGIDVELIKPIEISEIEIYFSARERQLLDTTTGEARQELFYELWTLKESFIKQQGLGLSIPLQSFSMAIEPPAQPSIIINGEKTQGLFFKQFNLSGNYKMAVCAKDNDFREIKWVQQEQLIKAFDNM